ncbi:MAG: LuxR C-terminal-related transcriptional regulator [Prevotellaceae bacterium]|jgi:DNA-binding CsgD family transcriptional regulator|nr:LuxR C-terminal-related transcriptional regulator [Prevotellaceae bacterium]
MSKVREKWEALQQQQAFDEARLDYDLVRRHMQRLEEFAATGSSSFFIFDVFKQQYIYASENTNRLLGPNFRQVMVHQEISTLDGVIHPDDEAAHERTRLQFYTFLGSLPPEERKHYQHIHHARIRNAAGLYVRYMARQQVLELDPQSNIWLILIALELAADQSQSAGFDYSVVNTKTGKRLLLPDDSSVRLSEREHEVLQLMRQGLLSKEISERLHISVHTVSVHRRNIFHKTGTGNAIEAIRVAEKMGVV